MSINFIIDLVIVVALGTILYLIARVLPRISDKSNTDSELKTPRALVYLEKADRKLKKNSEKFLRRVRVIILKFDNHLSNRLSKFKKDNGRNGGLKFDLSEEPSSQEVLENPEDSEDKKVEKENNSL